MAWGRAGGALGPAWFIDPQTPALAPKDKVTVVGSKVVIAGQQALVATEVRRDGETLKLRESNGTPVWAAWRRRPGS